MRYYDWNDEKFYATKEEAKKDYLNTLTTTPWGLAEIAFDYGPGCQSIIEWIEEKGLLKEFYLAFQENFDEGAERFATAWVEDLEEADENEN